MYLRQTRAAGGLDDDRPHERVIDTVPALMTGLQINACSCPHHNTPARQTAVLDDFLAGVRSRAVSS